MLLTSNIRLTSAVTVLSAADPVRVFQEFATLDLVSHGRAEIVAGRDSFVESFPLFGLRLEDFDSLFSEKPDLPSARNAAGPTTRAQFDAVRGPTGALLIGDAETVAEKILHVNDALGGISQITFQMGVSTLPHRKMLRAIEIPGTRVVPIVHRELAAALRVPDATLVAPSTPAHQAGALI